MRMMGRKKLQHDFIEVYPGILQCQECGYCKAFGEEQIHGAYHKSYLVSKEKYGEDNVLSYNVYLRAMEAMKEMLVTGLKQDTESEILKTIYKVKYTYSLRIWDYSRLHPDFDDFIVLLWNTPVFLDEIKCFVTDNLFKELCLKYKANRRIVGRDLICHKVEETSYSNDNNIIDLSFVDDLLESETPQELPAKEVSSAYGEKGVIDVQAEEDITLVNVLQSLLSKSIQNEDINI